jgi:hypothetical protein
MDPKARVTARQTDKRKMGVGFAPEGRQMRNKRKQLRQLVLA